MDEFLFKIGKLILLLAVLFWIPSCSLFSGSDASVEECFAPGYACPGRVTLSAQTYDFGNVSIGSTSTVALTLSNPRPTLVSALSLSSISSPFSLLSSTCTSTLEAHESCTLQLQYTPTGFSSDSTSLIVSYSDSYSSQTATFTMLGTGIASAPTVSSVSPSIGVSTGGTSITITGTHFVSGVSITLGGTSCINVSVVSSTSITCDTGAHVAGLVNVVVTNADSQTGTLLNGYTYTLPAPTLTSVNVNSGTTAGGTSVTLTGTNFVNGATITFGGSAATSVTFNSSTSITCNTPAHIAGLVDIIITNPDTQSATLSNAFTYNAPASATLLISDANTYAYPDATPTFSVDKTFTITNTGSSQATAMSGAAFGTVNFKFKGNAYPGGGTCGATLNASISCTVIVSFAPTTTGSKADTVTINYDDGSGMTTATRPVQGTSVAPGSFDTTFGGGNGYVSVDFGANDIPYSAVLQSDGKLLISGRSGNSLALARLQVDGSLDTGFNSTGTYLDGVNCWGAKATGIGVQSTGKIITSCEEATIGNSNHVMRLSSAGSLDATFGNNNGYFRSANITAVGPIKIFSDDSIAIGGLDRDSASDQYPLVAKLNSSATAILYEWDYGTAFNSKVMPSAIGIQNDGKIVTTLDDNWNLSIYRLDGAGTPDTTFGSSNDGTGYLYWGISGRDLAMRSDGSFVAVGTNFNPTTNFLVNTLNTSGNTPGVGQFGDFVNTTTSSSGDAIAVQSNDKFLVGGFATVGGNRVFGITRYLANFSNVDTTFANSGSLVTTYASNGLSQIKRLLIQSDGKILAVGTRWSSGSYDFAVARILP